MLRNPIQHGSGSTGESRDKNFVLRKGNEPIFVCMWINMLMLYEIYVFATGAEEFPGEEEPDANDFNDNAEYEVAMKEHNALIEKLTKGIRICKAWVVEILLKSPGYLDKAQRIINGVPEWQIRQIHQFVYCGFIAKTPKQVEKARKAFEECFQGFKELVANFAARLTNNKIIYESLSDEVVSEYDFLRRMMENLNVKFKQYGLIQLQDFKRTKALNDAEADPALHIAYPPPHNVIQDLEGLEFDMRTDERQDQSRPDHGQKKNNKNKKKVNQHSDKTDQVFTVSKADFEKLNNWKANKSKQGKGNQKDSKPSAQASTKSNGICFDFQNKGECKRQNCPYQHIARKHSDNNQMVPYRGNQQKRGGRGNGGRAYMSRPMDFDDYRPYEEHMRDREYRNYESHYPNSRTHFFHPRHPDPESDYYDAPPRDYGLVTGTRQVRGMRSETSRHGLSILMVTESSGNISPYKSLSNSKIHYTPECHNIIFDGYYCTENPRYAMYEYSIGKLIIPYHYYISMFRLLQTYTKYAPECLIITDTSLHIHCQRPVVRPTTAPPKPYIPKHRPYRFIEPRFNWT